MIKKTQTTRDPALKATVINTLPLFYQQGADPSIDRPNHVRAGSSLSWFGDYLALVQDDSNFLVLINPDNFAVNSITLPAGEDGRRIFDDLLGNKKYRLDLEACTTVVTPEGEKLLAFGSGSKSRREQILIVSEKNPEAFSLINAKTLYAQLRNCSAFAGSRLNIEGAIFLNDKIRLFNRGNGAAVGDLLPVNATCDLNWEQLAAYLEQPDQKQPPQPENICQYHLGSLGGLELGFTDATVSSTYIWFCASAEDSADVTVDGPVTGSVLGVLSSEVRWIELCVSSGDLFPGKVEGMCISKDKPNHVYLVVDADDPNLPCLLCEVELTGNW